MFNFLKRRKIASGLKYAWLNFLGDKSRVRALQWLSKAASLPLTLRFNQSIGAFRKALVILPEKPYELLFTQKSLIALKQHREDMNVEVIAESASKDILRSNPFIDGGIFYNRSEFFFNHPAFKELIHTLKERRYDACFLFNRNSHPLPLFLMAHSGAPLRVGFADADRFPFINLSIRPKKTAVYEGDHYESLLKTLGIRFSRSSLKWNIGRSTKKDVETLLSQSGYRTDQALIGIDVSPSQSGREFPADLLNGLIRELSGLNGAGIILFSSRKSNGDRIRNLKLFNGNIVYIPEEKISFASAFVWDFSLYSNIN